MTPEHDTAIRGIIATLEIARIQLDGAIKRAYDFQEEYLAEEITKEKDALGLLQIRLRSRFIKSNEDLKNPR